MHPSHQASSEILMVICFRAFLGVYAAGMANGFLSSFLQTGCWEALYGPGKALGSHAKHGGAQPLNLDVWGFWFPPLGASVVLPEGGPTRSVGGTPQGCPSPFAFKFKVTSRMRTFSLILFLNTFLCLGFFRKNGRYPAWMLNSACG